MYEFYCASVADELCGFCCALIYLLGYIFARLKCALLVDRTLPNEKLISYILVNVHSFCQQCLYYRVNRAGFNILVTYTTNKYESTLDPQVLVFKTRTHQYVPFDTLITANIHEKLC